MACLPSVQRRGPVTVVACLLVASACSKPPAPPPPPPPGVQVAQVVVRDVPLASEFVGQTRGSEEIQVQARVEGVLETQDFTEGATVRKGQLLFTIDPRQNQASLDQAKSRLAQAQADLARVQQDVERYRPLVADNALPRQQLETAVAQAGAARANVDAAKAVVEAAQLNVGYTRVTSPTDGIVGKAEVSVGNLVGRGQPTLLTTISKIDPIHVRFSVSEREYLRLARGAQERQSAGGTKAEPELRLVLADGTVHPYPGKPAFVDRLVDPTTGTLLIEAAFPNPERLLRPGQYARVRVVLDVKKDAVLVPQKAVQELQATFSVAVVGANDTVEIRPVQVGQRVGTLWLVEQGLKPGERVIVEGLQKVRPGAVVKPSVVPAEQGAPGAGA